MTAKATATVPMCLTLRASPPVRTALPVAPAVRPRLGAVAAVLHRAPCAGLVARVVVVGPAATPARLHPLPAAVGHRRVDDRDDLPQGAVETGVERHQPRVVVPEGNRQLRRPRRPLQR